jgi:4-amino-4-deoxychorismate lyase
LEALFPTTLKLPSERHSPQRGSRFGSPSPYSPTSSRRSSNDYFSSSSSRSRQPSLLTWAYEIWIDTEPTKQTTHTSFKTSSRDQYNAARLRALPDPDDYSHEVLLWNHAGQITEGSVLTPYFYRKGRWVTPAVEVEDHGGQQGTSRKWAFESGLCEEGLVERKSIRVGEKVWLSNGVRGFGWGRIQAVKRGDSSSENSL